MDMSALMISVERARRENGSALPQAAIRSDRSRWRRLGRFVHLVGRREDPAVAAIHRVPRSRPAHPSERR